MYQQFLLFAEKLMKLSFSETKFPLDALCKLRAEFVRLGTDITDFMPCVLCFLLRVWTDLRWFFLLVAKVKCFLACCLLLSSTALKKSLLLTLSFLSQPPQCVTCNLRGGVGVGSMTKIYGGRKRNGVCPSHFSVGSKNVARKVLQASRDSRWWRKTPMGE